MFNVHSWLVTADILKCLNVRRSEMSVRNDLESLLRFLISSSSSMLMLCVLCLLLWMMQKGKESVSKTSFKKSNDSLSYSRFLICRRLLYTCCVNGWMKRGRERGKDGCWSQQQVYNNNNILSPSFRIETFDSKDDFDDDENSVFFFFYVNYLYCSQDGFLPQPPYDPVDINVYLEMGKWWLRQRLMITHGVLICNFLKIDDDPFLPVSTLLRMKQNSSRGREQFQTRRIFLIQIDVQRYQYLISLSRCKKMEKKWSNKRKWMKMYTLFATSSPSSGWRRRFEKEKKRKDGSSSCKQKLPSSAHFTLESLSPSVGLFLPFPSETLSTRGQQQ